MTSLNVSNMQISSSLDSTKLRRDKFGVSEIIRQAVPNGWAEDTTTSSAVCRQFHWWDSKLASVYRSETGDEQWDVGWAYSSYRYSTDMVWRQQYLIYLPFMAGLGSPPLPFRRFCWDVPFSGPSRLIIILARTPSSPTVPFLVLRYAERT